MNHAIGRRRRLLLVAFIAVMGLPVVPVSADHPREVDHTVAAPEGLMLGHVFLLTQDHRLVSNATFVVAQTGFVTGSTGAHAGPWYELVMFEWEHRHLGDRYFSGNLLIGDVAISSDREGAIKMPFGNFGTAMLTITPRRTTPANSPVSLFWPGGAGYTDTDGNYTEYSWGWVLSKWDYVDVEGTVGDLLVTNRVPADADYLAGVVSSNEVATIAVGTTHYETNIEH